MNETVRARCVCRSLTTRLHRAMKIRIGNHQEWKHQTIASSPFTAFLAATETGDPCPEQCRVTAACLPVAGLADDSGW
jgi:hypothetical protein